MGKLSKFENVDVIVSLEAIMKQNTAFYQSDFEIDKRILREAASRPAAEEKRLLWFSRPSGTCCFRERDVFLKDTRQHNTWRFYGEQTRDILCYAMRTLRCCSIVMHIHDELVIEADPRMSLDAVCEQMGRTPPWAKGLLLRADGYATPFYKKN